MRAGLQHGPRQGLAPRSRRAVSSPALLSPSRLLLYWPPRLASAKAIGSAEAPGRELVCAIWLILARAVGKVFSEYFSGTWYRVAALLLRLCQCSLLTWLVFLTEIWQV
jgi:hypothetical protein